MRLTDDDLYLRPWRLGDLDALLGLMCDPETMQHTGGALTPEEAAQMLERYVATGAEPRHSDPGDSIVAVYAVEHAGEVVGSADVIRFDRAPGRTALEIGYLIARAHWRRGLGVRAARLLLGVARAHAVPGQDVLALVDRGHDASIGVLERIGLVPDGVHHDPDEGEVLVYVAPQDPATLGHARRIDPKARG